MRKHEEMLKKGRVSVWIGNMASEDELLCYVDDGAFGLDFDFKVNPSFGRELKVEKHATLLPNLVEGFSAWKSFAEALVDQAKCRGLTSANCMVVFYSFEYVPSVKTNKNAPLAFFGAFDFGK